MASRLGVLQQAVSGWERGTSRPETLDQVHAIAAFFPERELKEWLSASGYARAPGAAERRTDMSLPVRPLTSTLPLDALTPEQFQDFCATLLGYYYEGAAVHQYGGPGDMQLGIDIDVRLRDRAYYTFQCKRMKNFGRQKVRNAIAAHKVECDLAILLLSRIATADARREVKRKCRKKWDIWDAKDIADRVRGLPELKKQAIVDAYFPSHRKDFLGIEQPTAFESTAKYFLPYLQRAHIFSHAWTLVGRDYERDLLSRALEGPNDGVLVLTGPGGSGKTRLLRSVLEDYQRDYPEMQVSILSASAQPTSADFERVGSQAGVVVIEDAHDRPDMKAIAHTLARLPQNQRVLVTCRKYALPVLRADVESAGLLIAPNSPIELSGFTVEQAEAVAKEILKSKNGPIGAAHVIAAATHQSPLAVVIGAHLVAKKNIHPKTLNNASEFRQGLFKGFRDAISGRVGTATDQQLVRATLELIALVQPVADTETFSNLASKLISEPIAEIKRGIALLVEAGVLVRRARRYRIVPDLLGDYIIEDVLRRDADMTQRLVAAGDAEQVARLLVNTAKLDWRLSAAQSQEDPLSNAVWSKLDDGVVTPDAMPDSLLEGIVTAAYYQPEQALRLFDRLSARGGTMPEEFPQLLKHVAMNLEYVETACYRLLELGWGDKRPQNAYPNHPIRILKELAEIEPGKPVNYCERVVDFAIGRIGVTTEPGKTSALYEILESALMAEGHTTEATGLAFSVQKFVVRYPAVRDLRRKIIDFALTQLRSTAPISAARAAILFHQALRFPLNASDDVRSRWENEFVETMDRLATLVQEGSLDPNVLFNIEHAVNWHARFGIGPAHDAACRVIDAIPKTLEYQTTLAMRDAWGNTRMDRSEGGGWMERWRVEQRKIAEALLHAHPEPAAVVRFIEDRLKSIRAACGGTITEPGQFIQSVASQNEAVALALCEAGIPDGELQDMFSASLFPLMEFDPKKGLEIAQQALSAGIVSLTRQVTLVLAGRQCADKSTPHDERKLMLSLLSHSDEYVRTSAIRGAVGGARGDVAAMTSALLLVDLSGSRAATSEFFREIVSDEGLLRAFLVEDLAERVLEKIHDLPSIEDYWLEQYLARLSEAVPLLFVEFLLKRIEHDVVDEKREFQPLPYLWDEKMPFKARSAGVHKEILRQIREWSLNAPDHWAVRFWAPKLYVAISEGFDDESIQDLLAWAAHDPARFKVVSTLLREAPRSFVTNHVNAVSALFERAEVIGGDAVRNLRSSLFAAAVSGTRHGTPGQPFPEDIERKTRAEEALARLPKGSPVGEFYADLIRDADQDIRRKRDDDEALKEEYEE